MPSNRRPKAGKAALACVRRTGNSHPIRPSESRHPSGGKSGKPARESHPIHSANHSRIVTSVVACPYCNGSHTVTVPRESIVRTVRCKACGKLIHSPGENGLNACPCVLCTYGSEGCGRNRPEWRAR